MIKRLLIIYFSLVLNLGFGQSNLALIFEGTNTNLIETDEEVALQGKKLSIEALISPDTQKGILVKATSGQFEFRFVESENALEFIFNNKSCKAAVNLADGNWHLVTAVYDGDGQNLDLLINGILLNSVALTETEAVELVNSKLQIGQNYFGSIDYLTIWNKVFSGCETLENVNSETEMSNVPGVILHYDFNLGHGESNILDKGKFSNTGKLTATEYYCNWEETNQTEAVNSLNKPIQTISKDGGLALQVTDCRINEISIYNSSQQLIYYWEGEFAEPYYYTHAGENIQMTVDFESESGNTGLHTIPVASGSYEVFADLTGEYYTTMINVTQAGQQFNIEKTDARPVELKNYPNLRIEHKGSERVRMDWLGEGAHYIHADSKLEVITLFELMGENGNEENRLAYINAWTDFNKKPKLNNFGKYYQIKIAREDEIGIKKDFPIAGFTQKESTGSIINENENENKKYNLYVHTNKGDLKHILDDNTFWNNNKTAILLSANYTDVGVCKFTPYSARERSLYFPGNSDLYVESKQIYARGEGFGIITNLKIYDSLKMDQLILDGPLQLKLSDLSLSVSYGSTTVNGSLSNIDLKDYVLFMATYDGERIELYANDKLLGSENLSLSTFNLDGIYTIGKNYHGEIDFISIIKERKTICETSSDPLVGEKILYYDFNQIGYKLDAPILDYSAYHSNGTLHAPEGTVVCDLWREVGDLRGHANAQCGILCEVEEDQVFFKKWQHCDEVYLFYPEGVEPKRIVVYDYPNNFNGEEYISYYWDKDLGELFSFLYSSNWVNTGIEILKPIKPLTQSGGMIFKLSDAKKKMERSSNFVFYIEASDGSYYVPSSNQHENSIFTYSPNAENWILHKTNQRPPELDLDPMLYVTHQGNGQLAFTKLGDFSNIELKTGSLYKDARERLSFFKDLNNNSTFQAANYVNDQPSGGFNSTNWTSPFNISSLTPDENYILFVETDQGQKEFVLGKKFWEQQSGLYRFNQYGEGYCCNYFVEETVDLSNCPNTAFYLDKNETLKLNDAPTHITNSWVKTIELWARFDELPADNETGFSIAGLLGLDENNEFYGYPIQPGRWYHLAFTWNSVFEGDAYINGEKTPKKYYGGPMPPRNNFIGTEFFKGAIDELRFWNIKLSQQQILERMNQELRGNEDNLRGYYNFSGQTAEQVFKDRYKNPLGGQNKLNFSSSFTLDNLEPMPVCIDPAMNFDMNQKYVLEFNDSGHGVNIKNQLSLVKAKDDEFTVELWAQPRNANNFTLLTEKKGDSNGSIYASWKVEEGRMVFEVLDDEDSFPKTLGYSVTSRPLSLVDDEWYHFGLTYDAENNIRFYVDGQIVDEIPAPSYAKIKTKKGEVLYYINELGGKDFSGKIDRFRVWDSKKSDSELAALMKTSINYFDFPEGLVIGHNFNAGEGEKVYDLTDKMQDSKLYAGAGGVVPPTIWKEEEVPDDKSLYPIPVCESSDDYALKVLPNKKVIIPEAGYKDKFFFEFEVKLEGSTTGTYQLLKSQRYYGNNGNIDVVEDVDIKIANKKLTLTIGSTTVEQTISDLDLSRWCHIAGTNFGTGGAEFYFNGKNVDPGHYRSGSLHAYSGFTFFSTDIIIGGQGEPFLFDNFHNWIKPGESGGFNQKPLGSDESLHLCLPFDEGTYCAIAKDISGNDFSAYLGACSVVERLDYPQSDESACGYDGKNYALDFDGSDDFVNCGKVNLDGEKITIEAWVKWEGDDDEIYTIAGIDEENEACLLRVNNKKAQFVIKIDGQYYQVGSDAEIHKGVWTHISGVYDKDNYHMQIYFGEELLGTESIPLGTGTMNANGTFRVGQSNGGQYWKGLIDEVAVWTTARTASELRTDAENFDQTASGLRLYFTMNEFHPFILSSNRIYNGFIEGNMTRVLSDNPFELPPPVLNYALDFDGQNKYVDCGSVNLDGNQVTMEAWVKWAGGNNKLYSIAGLEETGNTCLLRIEDKKAQFVISIDGQQHLAEYNFETYKDEWTHVAGVYDGSKLQIYIGGELKGTKSNVSGTMGASGTFRVGQSYGGRYWNGLIDEVAVWTTARTGSEIRADAQNFDQTASGLKYYYTMNEFGLFIKETINNLNGELKENLTRILSDNPYELPSPSLNYALNFDESDWWGANAVKYVDCGDVIINGNQVTMEAWVKWEGDYSTKVYTIAGIEEDNGTCLLRIENKKAQFVIQIGNKQYVVKSVEDMQKSVWTHIAGVYDGSTMRLYVGGECIASLTNVLGRLNANGTFQIGKSYGGRIWIGLIDEVAVWTVARTAQEIRTDAENFDQSLSGLKHYYKMNEFGSVLTDSKNNLNGEVKENLTRILSDNPYKLPPGNYALDFDGENDYVECGQVTLSGDRLTMMAWVKMDAHSPKPVNMSTVMGIEEAGQYALLRFGNGQSFLKDNLHFLLVVGGVHHVLIADYDFPLNEWHHVAGVYDGHSMRIYIDGQEIASRSASGSFHMTAPFFISKSYDGRYLDGQMDDLAIWSSSKTVTEVSNDMNGIDANHSDLLYYWDLNEGNGNTANDEVKNHGANLVDMNPSEDWVLIYRPNSVINNSGGSNQNYALDFDGANDYVECGEVTFNGDRLTMMAWVKLDAYAPNPPYIATVLGIEESSTVALLRIGDYNAPKRLEFLLTLNGSVVKVTADSDFPLDGQWHHVVGVYDGSSLTIYIDNQEKGSVSASGSFNMTSPFFISKSLGDRHLDGQMDDIAVWSNARTESERSNDMNEIDVNHTDLLYYWDLNEGNGNIANDEIKNQGADLKNMEPSEDWVVVPEGGRGNSGGSSTNYVLDFDGTNDYLDCGEVTLSGNRLTMMAWVKLEGYAPESVNISTVMGIEGGGEYALLRFGNWESDLKDNLQFMLILDGVPQVVTSDYDFPLDEWHHVTGVYDGSSLKIYIDGQEKGSKSVSGSFYITEQFFISKSYDGRYLDGQMDDLAVWSKARTVTEISNDMDGINANHSDLLYYWDLNEGSGTTTTDKKKNQTGTLKGGLETNGWVERE